MKKNLLIIILFFLWINNSNSQNTPDKAHKNIVTKTIHSDILNEDRQVFVYIPNGTSDKQYPVIYLLDGKRSKVFNELIKFSNTNPHIIVGITNNGNRTRDMTPVKISSRPGSGGANQFLNFISTELKPFINKNYNTSSKNILIGASNSGLFTIYAMLTQPDAFSDYISLSPTIGYCSDFITQKVSQLKAKECLNNKSLYILYGLRNEMTEVTKYVPEFTTLLKNQFPYLRIYSEGLQGKDHVPVEGFVGGLNFVYENK
ncbi:alpha/beta hydrolase [Lentimicrobium sp. S6]|uniref:alpha/beta hydrolase n=1 Tax=Lentimicrobium sp. S6 TaxID=2735872 RepID=UPI001551ED4A|nr:alpha/beta hydrolase-fold protein [Lentimicrobium sp. S6]NPD47276.1 alpha/beta hydrolase [Lentimicrobium sp. S6]